MIQGALRGMAAIGMLLAAMHAEAASNVLTFSQSGAITTGTQGNANVSSAVFSPALPGYTLQGGDTLDLTFVMTSPLTLPPAGAFSQLLFWIPSVASNINGTSTGSFTMDESLYLGGALLASPLPTLTVASGPALILGASTAIPRSSAFSFDSAVLHVAIASGSSFAFSAGEQAFVFAYTPYPAVPEPGSVALMLAGLAGVFLERRRTRRPF